MLSIRRQATCVWFLLRESDKQALAGPVSPDAATNQHHPTTTNPSQQKHKDKHLSGQNKKKLQQQLPENIIATATSMQKF